MIGKLLRNKRKQKNTVYIYIGRAAIGLYKDTRFRQTKNNEACQNILQSELQCITRLQSII